MRRIARVGYALAAFFFSLAGPAWAQVDLKISQFPAASALTGIELFPCVQAGVTDKCTVTQAVTFTFSRFSGDCTVTSGGAITCTKTNGVAFGALATASTPLSVANGGNGTATPGITAATGITLGGSWPAQSVTLTTPVSVANGGTGTGSPGLVAGTNVTITGSWPNQTINSTASGGGGAVPGVGFMAGNWYTSLFHIPAASGATGTGNEYCSPFILQADPNNASFTTDQVALDITTLFATGNVQYGLRAPGTGANSGLPGTLLGNTASQTTAATGVFAVAWSANFSVSTGHGYWLCRQVDNATAVLEALTITGGQQVAFMGSTTATATITTPQVDLLAAEAFGTWTTNGASLAWSAATTNRSVWGAVHVLSIP